MAGLIFVDGLKFGERDDMRKHMLAWEKETGQSFFNFDKLTNTLNGLIAQGIRGVDDLYSQIDIREHITVDKYPGQATFGCLLRRYAYGWFHKGNGSSRYYSRLIAQDMPENPTTWAFDLVDLLRIYWNISSKDAVYDQLKETLPYVESKIVASERKRYEANRLFLTNYLTEEQTMLSAEDGAILQVVIDTGLNSLMDRMPVIEGQACFFASRQHLLKQLKTKGVELTQTKLSYRLSRLATLGLIRKVGYTDETAPQYKKSRDILKQKSKNKESFYNVISYFQIETFSRVIRHAEKRARYLELKHVRLDQINENEVVRLFGSSWAKRVYPEKTKKRVTKYRSEIIAYKRAFYWFLNKQGYVTKEQLADYANQSLANRLWTRLINRTLGVAKRFSQYLKTFLKTEGAGSVFLSYSLLHDFHDMIHSITEKGALHYAEQIKKDIVHLAAFWRKSLVKRMHIHRLDDGSVALC